MVKLVGILNVTPDSFSDGGQFLDPQKAIARAEKLFTDGASIIDVGAESTRPGATPLYATEEWRRLEPVLNELVPRHPGSISLDTYHPETVEKAFGIGPVIVNDVSGLHDREMVAVILKYKARCIISHINTPDIQAAHNNKPTQTIEEVRDYLLAKEHELVGKGLPPDNIILDPGIGFGKTSKLNWQLLEFAKHAPGKKIMIGYSRKRFLGNNRMELEPNLAAGKTAVASGAAYLRVHDMAGHNQLLS